MLTKGWGLATEAQKWEISDAASSGPFTLCPPRHETIYCRDVGQGRSFLLPFREGEEGGGLRPKGGVAAGAAGAPAGFAPFYLIFPQIKPRSGPSAAFTMLPGKAEKRIASSVFITLVPPQREAATKEKTQRETRPDGAEVPGTRHPQTRPLQPPALLNGGEGCPRGTVSGAGRMMTVLRMLRRSFTKGCACRQEGMWFFGGCYSPNPRTHPRMDPAAREGLCLLSIARRLSALFVPSGWDGVCFWGRSASAAAKLLGSYCDGVLLDIIAPPKPTMSGFCHRNPPSGPRAFVPAGPRPL